MIVRRPSRLTSPMSAQTFDVPTSMPTRTASRSTSLSFLAACARRLGAAASSLDEVTPDEGHVVEDPEPEVDEGDEVEIEAQPVADEGQQHRDDRVGEKAADEDPVVVDPVQLRADRSKDGVQRGEDRHRGVARELERDVDVEDESRQDA